MSCKFRWPFIALIFLFYSNLAEADIDSNSDYMAGSYYYDNSGKLMHSANNFKPESNHSYAQNSEYKNKEEYLNKDSYQKNIRKDNIIYKRKAYKIRRNLIYYPVSYKNHYIKEYYQIPAKDHIRNGSYEEINDNAKYYPIYLDN